MYLTQNLRVCSLDAQPRTMLGCTFLVFEKTQFYCKETDASIRRQTNLLFLVVSSTEGMLEPNASALQIEEYRHHWISFENTSPQALKVSKEHCLSFAK